MVCEELADIESHSEIELLESSLWVGWEGFAL